MNELKMALFTGATSGLGKDVTEILERRIALINAPIRISRAGRGSNGELRYNLKTFDNKIDYSKFDFIFHFAWDRSDLKLNSKNVRATLLLAEESKRSRSRLVLISSVEARQGNSEYAKQKRSCEGFVIAAGGSVLRLGAVIGGRNDFFSKLRKKTSIGPFKINLFHDPLMDITKIESLVDRILMMIMNKQIVEIETIVDESSYLSAILKVRNQEIVIRIPFLLLKGMLHMGGLLVPALAVWRDRFGALEAR